MSRERVVFVTDMLEWGGAEKHLLDLITRADPARVEPAILAFRPNLYAEVLRGLGRSDVPVHQRDYPGFLGYRRMLAELRPSTVVFVNGKLGLFPWWAYLAARSSVAKRVIGLEHLQAEVPLIPPPRRGLLRPLSPVIRWGARQLSTFKAMGALSHATVCVSHAVRRTLIDAYGYPSARTITVYNGIDLQYYRRRQGSRTATRTALGLGPNDQVLVCVGRLSRLKRMDILLRTVALLRERHSRIKCLIVGGGPLEEELKQQARSLGLEGSVSFVGHREDVRPYLEATDVYVTASEREGFGLALAEAMAFELPCVATNIGGHDEVLATPGTGVLVTPGSAELLASAIAHLLEHPAEARAMGSAARKAVEERFDVERMVRQLVDVFLGAKAVAA